jgi:copper chaperone CopZ
MKDRVVLGGSILTAVVASLCCIGPLVAAVLGLGAFSAAGTFETLRPYLLALTVLLLIAGFFLAYRRREIRCEDGICKVQVASKTSKILLWIVTVLVIGFATLPFWSAPVLRATSGSNALERTEGAAASAGTSVTIAVQGMTCDACAVSVQRALTKTPGVKSADVTYESGEAVVIYDPSVTGVGAIRDAIDGTGFKAGDVTEPTGRAKAPGARD